jgi:hypothetical protein
MSKSSTSLVVGSSNIDVEDVDDELDQIEEVLNVRENIVQRFSYSSNHSSLFIPYQHNYEGDFFQDVYIILWENSWKNICDSIEEWMSSNKFSFLWFICIFENASVKKNSIGSARRDSTNVIKTFKQQPFFTHSIKSKLHVISIVQYKRIDEIPFKNIIIF